MSDTRNPMATSIATEAADWYARLRAQDVSQLEAVRFRAWLAGDPARRCEFEAIDEFWDQLSVIENSPVVLRMRGTRAARRREKRIWFGRTGWALAATVILVLGGAWGAWQWNAGRYVTNVGEQRVVPLPDGSLITLNTDTEVRLHYSTTKRLVELVRGQANFEVARDVTRPFVVDTGGGEVEVLGTVFDVYKSADKLTVTLIEGEVAFLPQVGAGQRAEKIAPAGSSLSRSQTAESQTGGASGKVYLKPGEQLSYAPTDGVRRGAADVVRTTAWRVRKLDFSNTPILDAIAEANRYSREKIVLEAPQLEDSRISGTFEAGRNDLFAEGLQVFFALDVEHTRDNRLILKPVNE